MGAKRRQKVSCTRCRRKFDSENAVWTHISFKHPGSTDISIEFECCDCKQVYKQQTDLDAHVIEHHTTTTSDDKSDITTASSSEQPLNETTALANLSLEINGKPSIEQCRTYKYFCALCSKKFATENAIWTHATFKHAGKTDFLARYICDTCKLVFESKNDLERHTNNRDDVETQEEQLCQLEVSCDDSTIVDIPDTAEYRLKSEDVAINSGTTSSDNDADVENEDGPVIFTDETVEVNKRNVQVEGSGDNDDSLDHDGSDTVPPDCPDEKVSINPEVCDSDSSNDVSISDLLDEDVQSQIILLSSMLTNELLDHRVSYLEDKVLQLQTYLQSLVDGLLSERPDSCNIDARESAVDASSPLSSGGTSSRDDDHCQESNRSLDEVVDEDDSRLDMYIEPLLPHGDPLDALMFTKLKSPETEIGVTVEEVVGAEDSCVYFDGPSWKEDNLIDTRTRRKLLKSRSQPSQESELVEHVRKRSTSRNSQAAA